MSYLNYFKMVGETPFEMPEVEFLKVNEVSTEGLSFIKMGEVVVSVIKSVFALIKKIKDWIKGIISLFIRTKRLKTRFNAASLILKNKLNPPTAKHLRKSSTVSKIFKERLKDKKKYNRLLEGISQEKILDPVLHEQLVSNFNEYNISFYSFIFNSDGTLFNVDDLFNRMEKTIQLMNNTQEEDFDKLYKTYLREVMSLSYDKSTDDYTLDIGNNGIDGYIEYYLEKVNYIDLLKYTNDYDNLVARAESFYNKYNNQAEKQLNRLLEEGNKLINEITDENTDNINKRNRYKTVIMESNRLQIIAKAAVTPLAVLMTYGRLIMELVSGYFKDEEVISDDKPESLPLLHLSRNLYLGGSNYEENREGVLEPRNEGVMRSEFLPPRVCFSPMIEGCFNGIKHHLVRPDGEDEIGQYKYFAVYEGIPDKETKFVKPIIVKAFIYDYHQSKEIDTLTSIRIRFKEVVKIYYKLNRVSKTIDYIKHVPVNEEEIQIFKSNQ